MKRRQLCLALAAASLPFSAARAHENHAKPADAAKAAEPSAPMAKPKRDPQAYFTDSELVTQDGKRVRFYSDVLKGRTVVINTIYTDCKDACPVITAQLLQVRAKLALAAWSLREGVPLVCVGAAGGKRQPQRVEVADLAEATHDPLLASLRQRLRKEAGAPRQGLMGVRCVFSRESVVAPAAVCEADDPGAAAAAVDGSLNCHGYGSSVMVTATFGMVAAAQALEALRAVVPAPEIGKKADIL